MTWSTAFRWYYYEITPACSWTTLSKGLLKSTTSIEPSPTSDGSLVTYVNQSTSITFCNRRSVEQTCLNRAHVGFLKSAVPNHKIMLLTVVNTTQQPRVFCPPCFTCVVGRCPLSGGRTCGERMTPSTLSSLPSISNKLPTALRFLRPLLVLHVEKRSPPSPSRRIVNVAKELVAFSSNRNRYLGPHCSCIIVLWVCLQQTRILGSAPNVSDN